jgi:hypothetical protein
MWAMRIGFEGAEALVLSHNGRKMTRPPSRCQRLSPSPQRMVAGDDPRLHVFESVLREQGIDLADKKDVKIEEITVTNTLAQPQ